MSDETKEGETLRKNVDRAPLGDSHATQQISGAENLKRTDLDSADQTIPELGSSLFVNCLAQVHNPEPCISTSIGEVFWLGFSKT